MYAYLWPNTIGLQILDIGPVELGFIAPGKLADLVLLGADPLADMHNTTQIQAGWLRGKYFDRSALDGLLEAARHRSGKGKLH